MFLKNLNLKNLGVSAVHSCHQPRTAFDLAEQQ